MGDGNLTQDDQLPRRRHRRPRRVTYYYDWRDRLVATKDRRADGSEDRTTHRPIVYYTYDNLGEVDGGPAVRRRRRDASPAAAACPRRPRRACCGPDRHAEYDDQGRVYQTQVYSVDPSSGSVSTYALDDQQPATTTAARSSRSRPAAAWSTKNEYDGAGRATVNPTPPTAAAMRSWVRRRQRERATPSCSRSRTAYDADGNAIRRPARPLPRRRRDGTGALGNPTTGAQRPASTYAANYYDAADRRRQRWTSAPTAAAPARGRHGAQRPRLPCW